MKALVTGGGGFLGGAVVRQLLERGVEVRSLSRSRYEDLEALGVEQRQASLVDEAAVVAAVEGVDVVYHVAGKPGAWGPYQDYHDTNVKGTHNVVEACRRCGVKDLVYTSSPSVVFDGGDMEGVDESVPYPDHYEAHYPKTKAIAERYVMAAADDTLGTVSIRPHLIWGPRDTNLVPRIVERGRSGQLRRIGKETKLVDTIYIDDAARAHLLAADALADPERRAQVSGATYFVSADDPIDTWEMINRILKAAGVAPVTRTVSPRVAYAAGWLMEKSYGLVNAKSEPRMTRWVAKELSCAHWFDISAAKRDLGYAPLVPLEEGLDRLEAWLGER